MGALTLDWAVGTRARPGEIECGDSSAVVERPGAIVIAVADGLGHGAEAAEASAAAMETIRGRTGSAAPGELIELCHERLRRTRGVALSVATLDVPSRKLSWGGVGNVEGVLIRGVDRRSAQREAILLCGGIVGYHLPSLQVRTCAVAPRDVMIFVTDGIRSTFLDSVLLHESPQAIADAILHEQFRGTDDALVLVGCLTELES